MSALMALLCLGNAMAVKVKVVMNSTSKTMTMQKKDSGEKVETGAPSGTTYSFDVDPGAYIITGYASDGNTANGSVEVNVTNDEEQEIKILTCTIYATNSGWSEGEDYNLDVRVATKEGQRDIVVGNSTTAGRKTVLAVYGDAFFAQLVPAETHTDRLPLYFSTTVTYNRTFSGEIPLGAEYSITLPADANLVLGMKFVHFADFKAVDPLQTKIEGNLKTVTYRLANKQVYNYRTWREGGLTQAGYFTMTTDETKLPEISFTEEDYNAFGAKTVNHDVASNDGYETGDIFVNINPNGHLRLNVGESYDVHAMRSWQLVDNSTNNYFIEPDFHYTVLDVDGKPGSGIIEIENANTTTSPWTKIKAVGEGTALVTVTYDAIGLNYYSSAVKKEYLGGQYWGAIWPENTAVFVVTVGEGATSIKPNMTINEAYNAETMKQSGKYVDAEHDIFYFLDSEEGVSYTFLPEGVENVSVAYPTIGENGVAYTGFTDQYVKRDGEGRYTILLKAGRQIVRLTDASGKSVYQVLTAKPCHREITNETREGSRLFLPGDKVKVQYSGLRHPANKLAGIYNMSAFVTYNGVPNGTSIVLGASQYTFGSSDKAQAVTVEIPTDYNVAQGDMVLSEGVIQVNGYGDPIGNHRLIDPVLGRSANFNAVAHATYFGLVPDVRITVSEKRLFDIRTECNTDGAEVSIIYNGETLTANENGIYCGTYGTYTVKAVKDGYRDFEETYTIGDDAEGEQTFFVEMIGTDEDLITFEDVDLEGKEYYNGADGAGLFMASGSYSFMNYYNETYQSWCGFALSATTGSDFNGYGTPSEYNSCIGGGKNSKQFAVGYFSEYNYYMEQQAPAIFATKAYRPEYLYVNNAASSYLSMLNGDAYSKKFTEEDFLILTITGKTNDDEVTGKVDFYLAKDGKIVNEWTKVDLTPLGAVDYIEFTMQSSDTAYGFMNTPAYFCIDNVKAKLTDDVPTGVEGVAEKATENAVGAVYSTDGIKRERLMPGINIVRLSDGTVKTIMIR